MSAVFFRRDFSVKMTASRDPDPLSPSRDAFEGPNFPPSERYLKLIFVLSTSALELSLRIGEQ